MSQARDEAGNIWEVDAQGNAVRLIQAAGAGSPASGMTVDPNPIAAEQHRIALATAKQHLANEQLQHDKLVRDAQQAQDGTGFVLPTSSVHGDAYLASLPSGIAQEVKAISDGRMPLSARVMSSPKMQGLLQHVVNYDPTFDAVNYNTRAATRRDFTSGKDAANITALNTALGHAGSLMEAASALDNYGGVGSNLNPARNWLLRHSGDGRVDAYNVNKQAFASEMERVFRGTGGSLQGIQDWERSLSAANSPDQFRGVMGKAAELLKSRIDALNQQYRGGMGKTADITELLTPEAQDAYGKLYDGKGNVHVMFGGVNGQAGGNTPGGSSPGQNGSGPGQVPGGGQPGGLSPSGLATGATKDRYDAGASAVIDHGIRNGWSDAQINQALKPYDFGPIDPRQAASARAYFKAHPRYQGSFGNAVHTAPTTAWNRFAASPTGTGIYAATDAALGGTTDEIASAFGGGDLADLNARKQMAFVTNPKAAFVGQALGTAGSMAGLGAASRSLGIASRIPKAQLIGDALFGAASGAGQANDHRLAGATLGTIGGLAGNVVGNTAGKVIGAAARTRPGLAVSNRVRGIFGAPLLSDVKALSGADRTAMNSIDRAGIDNVTSSLTEAQQLGVPMSLADTSPNLRELAGAVVRRSPTASSFAEDALLPRARGQYDRFTSSVNSNLGPTANIPQLSADLTAQGRAAASDLYNRAYSNPVPSTPQLDSVLGTPFGRQALGRARTIAANEMRSPDELGFGLDADGNVVLNPRPSEAIARHLDARAELDDAQEAYRAARQHPNGNVDAARSRVLAAREGLRQTERGLAAAPDPSMPASVPAYTTQTLDYVKRGMDDVLEGQRNPITGKLSLDEAGRAQNGVRSQLLGEVDRLNPDYAAARAAYAGPVASRDALARGGDAYGLQPDELAMQVGNQTPEHLGQMQLGYRGAMVDHAGRIRDSGNPWNATLGSPVARQRLQTMYPDVPGVDRMIRQQELEKQLAQTTNAILGNSRTARNVIADQQFANPVMEGALHAGAAVATHGASVPGTAARLAGAGLKGRLALGLGKRAEAKADALAPILLNTDPVAALKTVTDYLEQQRARQALIQATTPKRLGIFGAALGSQAALAPVN